MIYLVGLKIASEKTIASRSILEVFEERERLNLIVELFLTFLKIGLFTFGGGLAMIPIIENICVEKKKWISNEEMLNITVLSQSTPGPIAINCATFVGYKKKGVPGAIAATFGVVLPSFCIICLLAVILDNFLEITIVANAFKGIKVAVGLLILDAAIKMMKKTEKTILSWSIMISSTVLMLLVDICSLHFSVITMLLLAGGIRFIIFVIRENGRKVD